ncbi:MAG: hypothetical protein V4735_07310 [Pseudomonadota bacterium]
MKNDRLSRVFSGIRRNESSASHLAVGALLVITVLYATMMM